MARLHPQPAGTLSKLLPAWTRICFDDARRALAAIDPEYAALYEKRSQASLDETLEKFRQEQEIELAFAAFLRARAKAQERRARSNLRGAAFGD
jgi:hypothetical protein